MFTDTALTQVQAFFHTDRPLLSSKFDVSLVRQKRRGSYTAISIESLQAHATWSAMPADRSQH